MAHRKMGETSASERILWRRKCERETATVGGYADEGVIELRNLPEVKDTD